MKNLLSKGTTNVKTAKNELPTFILYMSPSTANSKGINVCPNSSKGCVASCLFTAGMGVFSNVISARTAKTDYYLNDRQKFSEQLVKELAKINKKGVKTAIRLNGTSDLDLHSIIGNRTNLNVFTEFTNLEFYDYTKIIGKVRKYVDTPNYTITYSRSEDNEAQCIEVLNEKLCNVAVVFDDKKPLPKTWQGFEVIDGDLADDLMLKNKGIVIGLKAKGKAKKDTTGFVVR